MDENQKEVTQSLIDIVTEKISADLHLKLQLEMKLYISEGMNLYKEAYRLILEMREDFNIIKKKLKKIVDSPSLYADVYQMRDELIKVKKLLDREE